MDRPTFLFPFLFLSIIAGCAEEAPNEEPPDATLPNKPLLTVPDSPKTESYTISWTSSLGAKTYTLDEAENPAFLYSRVSYTTVDTSVTISGKYFGSFLFYRVRSHNDAGSSDWSTTKYVVVQYPVLMSTSFEKDTAFSLDGWVPFSDSSIVSFSTETPPEGGPFSLALRQLVRLEMLEDDSSNGKHNSELPGAQSLPSSWPRFPRRGLDTCSTNR